MSHEALRKLITRRGFIIGVGTAGATAAGLGIGFNIRRGMENAPAAAGAIPDASPKVLPIVKLQAETATATVVPTSTFEPSPTKVIVATQAPEPSPSPVVTVEPTKAAAPPIAEPTKPVEPSPSATPVVEPTATKAPPPTASPSPRPSPSPVPPTATPTEKPIPPTATPTKEVVIPQNLVPNSSFEQIGPDGLPVGWRRVTGIMPVTIGDPKLSKVVEGLAHSGNRSVLQEIVQEKLASGNCAQWSGGWETAPIPVDPNKSYAWGFWARIRQDTASEVAPALNYALYDKEGQRINGDKWAAIRATPPGETPPSAGQRDWKYNEFTIKSAVLKDVAFLRLRLFAHVSGKDKPQDCPPGPLGSIAFDDVSLKS